MWAVQVKVVHAPRLADIAEGRQERPVIQEWDGSESGGIQQLDGSCSYVYVCRKPY